MRQSAYFALFLFIFSILKASADSQPLLPGFEMETTPRVFDGPTGERIEIWDRISVLHVPRANPESLETATAWFRGQIEELTRSIPLERIQVLVIDSVTDQTEGKIYAGNRKTYELSELMGLGNTIGKAQVEKWRDKPRRLKKWQKGIELAQTIAPEGAPYYIGFTPRNGLVRTGDLSLSLIRTVGLGGLITASVVVGDEAAVATALVPGMGTALMSGFLQMKHLALTNWLYGKGLFRPSLSQQAGFFEVTGKQFIFGSTYYGMVEFLRFIAGLGGSLSSPLITSITSLLSEGPAFGAFSQVTQEMQRKYPHRKSLIQWASKTAMVAFSIGATSVLVYDQIKRSIAMQQKSTFVPEAISVEQITLLSMGTVSSAILGVLHRQKFGKKLKALNESFRLARNQLFRYVQGEKGPNVPLPPYSSAVRQAFEEIAGRNRRGGGGGGRCSALFLSST